MEHFSEEHGTQLLNKEWLVKADNQASKPYLFKFFSNADDQSWSCYVLLTDTKSVWAEVFTRNQFSRRWYDCNKPSAPHPEVADGQPAWRTATLELLSRAHTVDGIVDASFEIVDSNYSDVAFNLDFGTFKWRWETCFLGNKTSAEIISRHLIFPLISLNHLALSSTQPINELSDADLEKAVDKMGRTARRSVDTHIKNAMSKSRMALTLRRMVAIFNFTPDVPPINTTSDKPDLQVPEVQPSTKSPANLRSHSSVSPQTEDARLNISKNNKNAATSDPPGDSSNSPIPADSATESETDDFVIPDKLVKPGDAAAPPPTEPVNASNHQSLGGHASPPPSAQANPNSDSESSPHRPTKKPKPAIPSSDDDDSEAERKKRTAQLKGGSGTTGAKRGPKQPIKRGGKRF